MKKTSRNFEMRKKKDMEAASKINKKIIIN